MSTTLAALLSFAATFIGPIVVAWMNGVKSEAASKQQGADEANAAANKESADAQARMSEANAQPRDRGSVLGRLRDGSA